MSKLAEDPLLTSARREAIAAMIVWLCTLVYTITYCYSYGTNRTPENLTFVYGFPDWIWWGVVVPWVSCLGISTVFAFWIIQDQPLGVDEDEEADLG